MPIMVLIYQIVIVATLAAARIHSRRASTAAALVWSATTLILVFMPWLMALQLAVIWGTRHVLSENERLELPEGDPARVYVLIAAGCLCSVPFLLPFAVPLVAGAGVAGWATWRRIRKADESDLPRIPLSDVTHTTPKWMAHYVRACESPAESAFLRAMVSRYDLKPSGGRLAAKGISLELQKPIGRYRADFVANGNLVVEIDGAAYHGSPEAKARDARRDQDMRRMRYHVLRIPAKTVFRTPGRATRMVEEAAARIH